MHVLVVLPVLNKKLSFYIKRQVVGKSFLGPVEVVNPYCLKTTLDRCQPLGLEPPVAWIRDNAPNPFLNSQNILLFAVNKSKLQQTVTAVGTQSTSIKITNNL